MKFIEIPPVKKALGIALVAAVAYVLLEGVGIGAPARQLVGSATSQIKNFFTRLLQGKPSGS